jgi:hypothetical protein
MAANTAYLVTYYKDQVQIDLSHLPDLISVNRVEYPVGNIPQTFLSYDVSEDNKRLTLGSDDDGSQVSISDTQHIRIYYTAQHIPPNEYSPGSIPEFLEDTVLMAGGAYALMEYALKQEHQAETDLTAARTSLTAAATAQTALATALTNVKKYLDNNTDEDAAGILADITDETANLRTSIETALDAVATHTTINTATGAAGTAAGAGTTALTNANIATWLGDVNTALDAVITALGLVSSDSLDKATTGAEDTLDTGMATIITINQGAEQTGVADAYANYAATRAAIANARVNQAIAYVQEAAHRIAGVESYINQAAQNVNIANAYANQANAISSGFTLYISEAAQRIDNIRTYIEQAKAYISIAEQFKDEAVSRNEVVQAYLSSAEKYITASNQDMLLADKYRTDALARRDEVWTIWRDKRQYIGVAAQVSNNQYTKG